MQNETPYSLLVWENISNLPFPKEVKELIKEIKWDKFEWHALGLPVPFAKYNVTDGKELYLSELPDGEIKVERLDEFTGNILMGGYFMDDENAEGFNYFVNFVATIIKGGVSEVKVHQIHKQPVKEYQDAMMDFQNHIEKVAKRSSSWWYKWLYCPWHAIVYTIGYSLLFILKFFKATVVTIVKFLTPI